MKNIPADISPFAVLTMTNGIGALLLGTAFHNRLRKGIHRREVICAVSLAVMNIAYNALIILGLRYMNAAAGSVIISFTLAVLPLMLLVMGIISLGILLAGFSKIGSMDIRGPLIMLAVCVIRAFYIIKMNDFAKNADPGVLSVLIDIFVTLISFGVCFVIQPRTFFAVEYSKEMLSSAVMEGYLVCGYAAFINLTAQKYAAPATCSAVYSFQIIFAVILAAVIPDILGEAVPITLAQAVGCLLIVGGTLCSDDDHLALVVADVSGKGVPAALFMVIAKTLLKDQANNGIYSPGKILADVNNKLHEGNEADLFVTVWLAIIEISTGKGKAANAGHEHPALRRKGGKFELVQYRHSLPLATLEDATFREHDFELFNGDTIFVYTDGVPEATTDSDMLYGTDRMLEALNAEPDAAPKTLLSNVKASVDAFVGRAPQFDDLTMPGFTYFGKSDTADSGSAEA